MARWSRLHVERKVLSFLRGPSLEDRIDARDLAPALVNLTSKEIGAVVRWLYGGEVEAEARVVSKVLRGLDALEEVEATSIS